MSHAFLPFSFSLPPVFAAFFAALLPIFRDYFRLLFRRHFVDATLLRFIFFRFLLPLIRCRHFADAAAAIIAMLLAVYAFSAISFSLRYAISITPFRLFCAITLLSLFYAAL